MCVCVVSETEWQQWGGVEVRPKAERWTGWGWVFTVVLVWKCVLGSGWSYNKYLLILEIAHKYQKLKKQ